MYHQTLDNCVHLESTNTADESVSHSCRTRLDCVGFKSKCVLTPIPPRHSWIRQGHAWLICWKNGIEKKLQNKIKNQLPISLPFGATYLIASKIFHGYHRRSDFEGSNGDIERVAMSVCWICLLSCRRVRVGTIYLLINIHTRTRVLFILFVNDLSRSTYHHPIPGTWTEVLEPR